MALHTDDNLNSRVVRFPAESACIVIKPLPASCTLELKVIPNAPRNEVAGWLGDALKVRIHAPAIEGRANDALTEFLAEQLGVPRRAIVLLRGDRSHRKTVQISGLTLSEVHKRLRI